MFIDELEKFRNNLGIRDIRLSTYGLTEDECVWMGRHGVNDLNMEGNPRDITEPEYVQFLLDMMN